MKLTVTTYYKNAPMGTRTVRALRIGELAVHPTLSWGYTVTHIRTGRAVQQEICCKRSAVDLATKLRGFNWAYNLPRKKLVLQKSDFPMRVQASMSEAAKIVHSWECPVHPNGQKI